MVSKGVAMGCCDEEGNVTTWQAGVAPESAEPMPSPLTSSPYGVALPAACSARFQISLNTELVQEGSALPSPRAAARP